MTSLKLLKWMSKIHHNWSRCEYEPLWMRWR